VESLHIQLGNGISPSHVSDNCRIFYVNCPAVVIAFIGLCLTLTLRTDPAEAKQKLKRIDVLGVIVFVGSWTSFLFGLTAGGVLFPWTSGPVILPLVMGFWGLVGFYYIEEHIAEQPMLPMRVFKERTAFIGYVGTWAHGIILWGMIYYASLWVSSHLNILI
jgi:hypothetical protein